MLLKVQSSINFNPTELQEACNKYCTRFLPSSMLLLQPRASPLCNASGRGLLALEPGPGARIRNYFYEFGQPHPRAHHLDDVLGDGAVRTRKNNCVCVPPARVRERGGPCHLRYIGAKLAAAREASMMVRTVCSIYYKLPVTLLD